MNWRLLPPGGKPDQTVDDHQTHYRLSLVTAERQYDPDGVYRPELWDGEYSYRGGLLSATRGTCDRRLVVVLAALALSGSLATVVTLELKLRSCRR